MIPRPSDLVACALCLLAEAILIVVILKRGAAKRWPFLLAIALFDLLHNYLLYTHLGLTHYRQYFYIYWYGQGIRSLLSLGVIWDIARSIPCFNYVPKRIGLLLATFGLVITVGSVLMTMTHHSHWYKEPAMFLLVQECVRVAWMCVAMSLLGSISFLGFGWPAEPLNITAGFLISGLSSMITASLISSWPMKGHKIDLIHTCIETAVFVSWSVVLCRPSLPGEALPDSALNAILNELLEERPLV